MIDRRSDGGLGRGRRKITGLNRILKISLLVRAVAKWLVGRMSAAAQANRGAPRKAEGLAGRVYNLEISLDAQRAIICGRNFYGHAIPFVA